LNPNPDPPKSPARRAAATRSAHRRRPTSPSDPLMDLQTAAQQFHKNERNIAGRSRGAGLALAVVAALLVGAALTFLGGFQYRCVATIRVSGPPNPHRLTIYRQALLARMMDSLRAPERDTLPVTAWGVEALGDDTLRLAIIASDREDGTALARTLAQGYCEEVQRELANQRETPDDAERLLSQYVSGLRERLTKAEQEVENAIKRMPAGDPRTDQAATLTRWRTLRDEFTGLRAQLAVQRECWQHLQTEPEPTHGLVSAQARRKAVEGEPAITQDLAELKVNLSELKRHLLTTWREASAKLEALMSAAEALKDTTTQVDSADRPPFVARFHTTAKHYLSELDRFAQVWNREFTALEAGETDPHSGDILERHAGLRALTGDFFFKAAERLASMRTHAQTINEGLSDNPRHHVFYSNLLRAFRTAQSLHHRFEFAADTIKPANNFRLDAAYRSAKGLRRRSQQQLAQLEERLQAEARQRAVEERTCQIAEAKQAVQQTRERADRMIEEIVALQDQLNLSSQLTEEFLSTVLRTEFAGDLADVAAQDLNKSEELLHSLEALRLTRAGATALEVVSCEASDSPVNLPERLRTGGLAALITLLSVGLLQWWFARRA